MPFFEKIGKTLSDAGQNVAQQTKNIADITQLNNAIAEREKQIENLYRSLGESYYEKHRNESSADDFEKIAEINALKNEIVLSQEKIKQIKGVTKCEACGADVPLDAAFCNACGAKVVRVAIERAELGVSCVCPVCHASVESGNAFCTQCGAKIGK